MLLLHSITEQEGIIIIITYWNEAIILPRNNKSIFGISVCISCTYSYIQIGIWWMEMKKPEVFRQVKSRLFIECLK